MLRVGRTARTLADSGSWRVAFYSWCFDFSGSGETDFDRSRCGASTIYHKVTAHFLSRHKPLEPTHSFTIKYLQEKIKLGEDRATTHDANGPSCCQFHTCEVSALLTMVPERCLAHLSGRPAQCLVTAWTAGWSWGCLCQPSS